MSDTHETGRRFSGVYDSCMLSVDDRSGIRRLTLDRPERKNAIPTTGWQQLADAFREFEASDQRVLVMTGAGGDFCSGADLSDRDRDGLTVDAHRKRMAVVGTAATALHEITKPTIAAVDGVAAGAGMNLALGCDLVIATDRARFTEIFVRRGLTVDFGGTWLLPRVVGRQRAMELALTGRIVESDEAVEIGLALEQVAADNLQERVTELAETIAAQSPLGQRFAKHGLNAAMASSFDEALMREGNAQAICLGSGDVVEGVAAFMERRPPNFTGR